MGTKLKYFAINPLASSQNSNSSCSFTVHFVDDYFRTRALKNKENYCEKIELDRFGSSMDKVLERYKMESIRQTMQMHEDIFRHQVRELHRLYSVQRMLMDELKKEIKQNRLWPNSYINQSQSQFNNQLRQLTTQTACGLNFHVQGDPIRSREKSGNYSGDHTMRIARGFDLERPAAAAGEDISAEASAVEEDESGPNLMSIELGSDVGSEVELTLSIGGKSSKKMLKKYKPHSQELGCTTSSQSNHMEIKEFDSSASFKLDKGSEDCSGPNTPMSSSSTTFDQEKKRPPWLFQGLSINRT